MLDLQPDDRGVGDLWRDVLNFLGDREITPDEYLPLADAVLPRWAGWPSFVGRTAEYLAENRAEVEADVARARIGWRLWAERREDLRAFAEKVAKHPVDDEDLRRWWVLRARGEMAAWDVSHHDVGLKRALKLQSLLQISEEEDRILRYHPERRGNQYSEHWYVSGIHWDLSWVDDLEMLRRLAGKTWPADPDDRQRWTREELDWANGFYEEQQPYLMAPDESPSIDPFDLEIFTEEQPLGYPLSGLRAIELASMRSVVIDFADSVLERSKHPNARGSLSCIECGRFVGRRALGYGQLYCTDRCKKRAAKRRYRGRVATKPLQRLLVPLPPYVPVHMRPVAQQTGEDQ